MKRYAKEFLAGMAAVGMLSVFLLTGCDEQAAASLVFSHYQHVTENGAACADCHGKMADGRFAKPGHAACVDCHEEWVKSKDINEKTCGKCHKVKDAKALAAATNAGVARAADRAGGVFAHTQALTNRCADCHSALLDKSLKTAPSISKNDRIVMRDRVHNPNANCASCHVDMDPTVRPASHSANWQRRHGVTAAADEKACAVCHRENSCRECHETTMPDSHNNLWRRETHGRQAAWDRSRCLVCHQQDSCDACHATVKPRTHNASWQTRHCQECHPSAKTGTGCTFCHKDGLDSHPDPHGAGWRSQHCDKCHQNTPEGKQCAACHPGSATLATHPNPHSGGWMNRHCDNCHSDSREGRQCKVCHSDVTPATHKNPHNAGWRSQHCDNCHAGQTDERRCGTCHVGVTVATHPNPHSIGYRSSHCKNCHEGTSDSAQCAICHPGGNSKAVHIPFWPAIHTRLGPAVDNCSFCHR